MQQMKFDEVDSLIKSRNLNYFNFYNVDIPTANLLSTKHYLSHPNDNIEHLEQPLHILFEDIEVFSDDKGVDTENHTSPITVITFCTTKTKILHSFMLLREDNFQEFGISTDSSFNMESFISSMNEEFRLKLIEMGYIGSKFIPDDFKVDIHIYNDERQMIKDCWQYTHHYDPDVLTSWNGDNFDYPYEYGRTSELFGKTDADNIFSKFGVVNLRNGFISIVEYTIADLLNLYKPRDEGGLILAHVKLL